MNIQSFVFNLFGVNTYIVWDGASKEAAIIDPGMSNPNEQRVIIDFIEMHRLSVRHLINTHLHIDHTLGNDYITQLFGTPTEAHIADAPLGEARAAQAQMFHLRIPAPAPLQIAKELNDGNKIYLGNEFLTVISVPGHSPGSIALYCPQSGFVITGDALFQRSIGRTDLPGGNHAQLLSSIRSRLLTLPENTMVYPGHGGVTTIGDESRFNPFL